ncbi:MAG: hypothetical protein E6I99_01030 [Chloroflexi bacterium]|nr:MAG: hypothetical protein E6I99_01030 [Chloroflexota bacterium]
MNNRPDLESRLRAYLSSGARTQPPSGMEERIARRVVGRRYSWTFQLMAAAAVLVLAIGLGIGSSKVRQWAAAVKPSPSASAIVSPSASASPSVTPSPEVTYPLMPPSTIKMINASAGWAAGSTTDRILRTTDGGSHWNDVTPRGARLGTWTTFFLDADNAWLASSLQPGSPTNDFSVEIYRTLDGGRNWSQVGMSVAGWGFPGAIDFVDRQHGWLLMKQDGSLQTPGADMMAVYGTADGGASWKKLSETDTSGLPDHLPQACSKTQLVFLNATTGWIQGGCGAGGGYFLYVTRDGGGNWTAVALRVPQLGTTSCDCSIESLRFWDKQHGALVLNGAYQDARGYAQNFLYTTTDGGRSWQLGPLLPTNAFSVFFLDATHGWTLNAKANTLLFTGDGGQHWSTAGTIPSNSNGVVTDFQFVSAQVGWTFGADSRGLPILKTVDGGQTWTTQLAP